MGQIAEVRPLSCAQEIGLMEGDRILTINGQPSSHYLQFEKEAIGKELTLEVLTKGGKRSMIKLHKEEGEPLGVKLYGYIYDGLKMCNNRCVFCFVDQMPKGMRKTLYLKDDDYRFSFYQGAYISMSNLQQRDLLEIAKEGLSPLYVSIHTTNPMLRAKILGNGRAKEILGQLRFLKEHGISFHGQLVLIPSLNDGEELKRTLRDLEPFYPSLESLSLIPVGLTSHRKGLTPLRPFTPKEAEDIITLVLGKQKEYKERFGQNMVYGADEFYFLADKEIPPGEEYDDFPQYENGVGLTRSFYLEVKEYLEENQGEVPKGEYSFITSPLGYRALKPFLEEMEGKGLYLNPLVVENKTFGKGVTITGLLTGQDIMASLREVSPKTPVLLPGHLLNHEGLFLDGVSLKNIIEATSSHILVSPPTGNSFLKTLEGMCAP